MAGRSGGLASTARRKIVSDQAPELPSLERQSLLEEAIRLTTKDRNVQYGDPLTDFKRIAAMWTVMFDREFQPHEVAMALIALKLSRLTWTPGARDSWADAAGYSACGFECAVAEAKT